MEEEHSMVKKKKKLTNWKVRKISNELGDLIDKMKKPIEEFSWGAVKVSDHEASKVLARKITEAKIV